MLNQVVQVTIGKDGKYRVEYSGFAGDTCYKTGDAFKGLLARLGITWRPRLARAAYADMTWRVASPLIQNGEAQCGQAWMSAALGLTPSTG